MDKQTFMQELEHRLRHLPEEDKNDALEYYSEYIDDMHLEPYSDVCVHLGTPKEVARQIIAQTTERKVEEQQESRTTKGFGGVLKLAMLGIFAAPLALPFAIVIFILFLTLIITLGSLLFAFGVSGIAVIASGIGLIVMSFMTFDFAQKCVILGSGFVCAGVGIFLLILTRLLCRVLVAVVRGIIGRFAARHSRKEM